MKIKQMVRTTVLYKYVCLLADAAAVWLGYFSGIASLSGWQRAVSYMESHAVLFLVLILVTFIIFYMADIYPNYRKFNCFLKFVLLWKTLAAVFVVQGILIYLLARLGGYFALAMAFQFVYFTVFKFIIALFAQIFRHKSRAIIVGNHEKYDSYFRFFKEAKSSELPYEIVGVVADNKSPTKNSAQFYPLLGPYAELEAIIEREKISTLILISTYAENESLQDFLIMAYHHHVNLILMENLYSEMSQKIPYDTLSKSDLLAAYLGVERFAWMKKKRVCDVLLSSVLLLLLSPLAALMMLGVKLSSPGSVFYFQERVGFRGRSFKMIKFRTMRMDAEKHGISLTAKNDPRVTPFGRFLRKTHLDEIPQLLNVLQGEMSFVGPRPERRVFIEKLEKKIPVYALRLLTKPGITGWAQVSHGYAATVSDLEEKLSYDLYYIRNMHLALDLKIILLTVQHLFLAKGQ